MPPFKNKPAWIAGVVLVLVFGIFFVVRFLSTEGDDHPQKQGKRPTPVEVAAIHRGTLSLHRTFSGTIEPQAQLTVAPKVSGRILRLQVDVSERVTRGQVVAQLEDDEFKQAVVEAEARRAVAEANRVEAQSRLEIAQRQLVRAKALHEQGIASDSDLDSAQAEFLASQAAIKVAEANLKREEAALAAANIRLGYTRIQANWEQGDNERTVAERYADEGDTVAANTPLFNIVELDPVIAVIQVTEKDYPRIAIGQQAGLRSDAFPGRAFIGTVSLIAPIFRESSRQARVELNVPNPDHLLKPGMFSRCTLELDRVEEATSVPEMAITRRNNRTGVFLVVEDGTSVKWIEVKPGLQDGIRVQLVDSDLSGRVVTLGQQLIEDGAAIYIPAEPPQPDGGTGTP
jgi:RND family efflux transporter MFP subunit